MALENTPIQIIGASGITSYLALILAKKGVNNIIVHDNERVNEDDTANQLYTRNQMGVLRVVALKDTIYRLTGQGIKPVDTGWDFTQRPMSGIFIINLPTLVERYEFCKKIGYPSRLIKYIDARIGLNHMDILTGIIMKYKDTFTEPIQEYILPMKETSPEILMMGASLVTNQIFRVLGNERMNDKVVVTYSQN